MLALGAITILEREVKESVFLQLQPFLEIATD